MGDTTTRLRSVMLLSVIGVNSSGGAFGSDMIFYERFYEGRRWLFYRNTDTELRTVRLVRARVKYPLPGPLAQLVRAADS